MLRFGPATGPVAVVALPLFEEANRTRAFAVTICRALAKRGVGSVLPDLPGQGESLVPTESARLTDWRGALAAAAAHAGPRVHLVALRSGATVASEVQATSHWQLSPISGGAVLMALQRTLVQNLWDAGKKASLKDFGPDSPPAIYAGNKMGFPLFADLLKDENLPPTTVPTRTVRLDTDPKPSDRHVPGAPLWRRSEPDNDPALAALLADDIADWIATCEG